MFDNLQKMGFTVAELDKFSSVIKKASPNLATLGVTAADGAKVFSDSMGVIKNTGVEEQLRMLGFNSESIAKTFADYQGLMGRQGFLQGKSTAEIAKRSSDYAKTLDELSKLTGESRDELQRRMDADANDIKFRLKIQELERSGQTEAAARLRKASALIGEFSEDTSSGFREMVANNGKVVGEASAKLMLSTGNAARQIAMDLNSGKITAEQAALELTEAKAKQVERFREIGKLDADIMRELGLTVKDMDAISKFQGKSMEDINQVLADQEAQAKGELDGQRRAEVQRQMTERNFEQAKDKLTNIVGNVMVGAFEKLLKMLNAVGKGLAEFAYKISFGTVDLRDAFKSTDDIGKGLLDLEKQIKQVDQSIAAEKRKQTIGSEITAQEGLLDLLRNNIEKETNSAKKTDMQNKLVEAEKKMAELNQVKKSLDATKYLNPAEIAELPKKRAEMEAQYKKQAAEYQTAGGTFKAPARDDIGANLLSLEKQIKQVDQSIAAEKRKQTIGSEITAQEGLLDLLRNNIEKETNSAKKTEMQNKLAEAEKKMIELNQVKKSLDATKYLNPAEIAELPKKRAEMEAQYKKQAAEYQAAGGTFRAPASSAGGGGGAAAGAGGSASYLQKIAQLESSGDASAQAKTSSAAGLFQFTKGTWEETTKLMGKNYTEQDRFDPAKSAEVAKFFTEMQGGKLEKALGRQPNDSELYMAHFLGAGGAIKFLKALSKNPGGPASEGASQEQIDANPSIFYEGKEKRLRSLEEVYNLMSRKLDKAGEVIAQGRGGKDLGSIPVIQEMTKEEKTQVASVEPTQTKTSSISEIPMAALGGLFSGPKSGYPVMLHGRELVIPMPNVSDITSAIENVSKEDLTSNTGQVAENKTANLDQFITLQTDLMNMIASKLDSLDSRMAKSNDIQENILTYSAA